VSGLFADIRLRLTALLKSIQKHMLFRNEFAPVYAIGKGKGKAVPLQAWSDPEGSRKLRFPDFTTTAQDGGKVVSLTHRPPLPQEIHLVLISVRG